MMRAQFAKALALSVLMIIPAIVFYMLGMPSGFSGVWIVSIGIGYAIGKLYSIKD
jgi:hypothetical protein